MLTFNYKCVLLITFNPEHISNMHRVSSLESACIIRVSSPDLYIYIYIYKMQFIKLDFLKLNTLIYIYFRVFNCTNFHHNIQHYNYSVKYT